MTPPVLLDDSGNVPAPTRMKSRTVILLCSLCHAAAGEICTVVGAVVLLYTECLCARHVGASVLLLRCSQSEP